MVTNFGRHVGVGNSWQAHGLPTQLPRRSTVRPHCLFQTDAGTPLALEAPGSTTTQSGDRLMAFVVCEPCRDCKYTDCVVVCPCDCFYQDDTMLYIHAVDCIDCEACVPECPVE